VVADPVGRGYVVVSPSMSSEPVLPPVITISASYGAGGSEIGPRLADRLGVPFVDRAIPAAVSDRLSVSIDEVLAHEEPPHGVLGRLVSHLAPATLAIYGGHVSPQLTGTDETFRVATERILHEHARAGAIILGRGAAVVLGEVEHVTHVRLHGPRERRLEQAMRVLEIDRATAERQMRAADLSREAYVRHWYHADSRDPKLYHLVIDSTSITLDACIELIARASLSRVRTAVTATRTEGRHAH
jgi:cytidylate kinase